MTRKDYVAIAETMARTKPDSTSIEAYGMLVQWRSCVRGLMNMLDAQARYDLNGNRLFNRDKFMKACGYE